MLLFSTILSIKESLGKDDFIKLAISWNQGSPHKANVIPDIVWNGERNIKFGSDKLWMEIEEYRNQNIIAIRYEKIEDNGVAWDTDYVMNFNEMKMSIRLDRSFLEEAQVTDTAFSTPAFIALLIHGGYIEPDEDLEITSKPLFLDESNIQIIADVINDKRKYQLPIVYVSKTFGNNDPVDIYDLAKKLRGCAHVIVQKDSDIGTKLRSLTDGRNEYNGAIGVYFPNQIIGHRKYLKHDMPGSDAKLFDKVVQSVLMYCTSQRVDRLYTWAGVDNALLSDRYTSKRTELQEAEAKIRASVYLTQILASQNAEYKKIATENENIAEENRALVESVDDELKSMSQKIDELTKRNDALIAENQGLRTKINGLGQEPILYFGTEDEFFDGEIKEFVLSALTNELSSTKPQTRRADVLSDIIRSNGGFKNIGNEKAEELKKALKGTKSVSNSMMKTLKDMGFEISHDGGHYKLTYYGDARYLFTLASTPSDSRSGMNQVEGIIKLVL